jgi:hypothetical protein
MLRGVRTRRLALSFFVGAAALAAPPASAFVRTLGGASPDGGGRHYVWWPTREVGYRIQSECAPMNPPVVSAGEDAGTFGLLCRSAIGLSAQAWNEAGADPDAGKPPCTDMGLKLLGETPLREVGYNPKDPNEGNLILFQPQDCTGLVAASDPCWNDDSCDAKYACFSGGAEVLASTLITIHSSDGILLDADIEVNAAPPTDGHNFSAEVGTPLGDTADIQDTVTHELGHVLGLNHNCGFTGAPACTPELMLGTMYGGATAGEIVKRTLKADDIAGLCHIYPTGVDTRTVNLSDEAGLNTVTVTGHSCASARGAPGSLGLTLTLLLALRRRHP